MVGLSCALPLLPWGVVRLRLHPYETWPMASVAYGQLADQPPTTRLKLTKLVYYHIVVYHKWARTDQWGYPFVHAGLIDG